MFEILRTPSKPSAPASPTSWLDRATVDFLAAAVRDDPRFDATVVLDAGGDGAVTIGIHHGKLAIRPGRSNDADTVITSDAATFRAMFAGEASGIGAFLEGHLTVRKNLALAFHLDTLLDRPGRDVRFPREAVVDVDGIRTSYLEAGQGTPVVLLHGLGATNASMLPLLWELAKDHRVLAPDLPGFGNSDKPFRAYHAAFYARWLRGFLDATGIERAHLVGNSMGGRVAIELDLRHPERANRLVLLAPSPAWKRFRQAVPVVRVLVPELAMLPLRIPRSRVEGTLRWMFSKPSRLPTAWYDAAVDEFLRVFRTTHGRVAFLSAARQIYLERPHGERGFWDRLSGLEAPTLFVWGDRDPLVPASFAAHVARAIPHVTSVTFEDCGHVPQFEFPEKTNRLVRDFLSGV